MHYTVAWTSQCAPTQACLLQTQAAGNNATHQRVQSMTVIDIIQMYIEALMHK